MARKPNNKTPKKTLKQKRKDQRAAEALITAQKKEEENHKWWMDRSSPIDVIAKEEKALETLREWKEDRNKYFRELREAARDKQVHYSYESSHLRSLNDAVKKQMPDKVAVSHLLEICRRSNILDIEGVEKYLKGIVNLACYRQDWIKDPDFWKPSSKNRERQFFELTHYLLAKYEIPKFFDKYWLEDTYDSKLYREWFIHLGRGENIRKQKKLPLELTKRMAHEFIHAPCNLEVKQAFRWAQMKSIGANERQIRAVLGTPIGESFSNERFWSSVIKFFVDNPMLDLVHYRPIYDYIHNQKYVDQGWLYEGDEMVAQGVAQPNFSMHHRNPHTLLAQVERWHRDMQQPHNTSVSRYIQTTWKPCGLPPFTYKQGKDEKRVEWRISELLNGKELAAEGNAMHHCVLSYANSCASRRSAIFSMMKKSDWNGGAKRELTIELLLKDKTIGQVRKKYNADPTPEDLKVLKIWANKYKLKLSNWIY